MEPGRMWVVVALVAGLLAFQRYSMLNSGVPVATLTITDSNGVRSETIAEADCRGKPGRLWVEKDGRAQCVAYVGPAPLPQIGNGTAVVFFRGDIPAEDMANETTTNLAYSERQSAELTKAYQLPVIIVGRLGTMGSTGHQVLGGSRIDAEVMSDAVNQIAQLYGLRQIAFAGQSGGARLIAHLLILGRSDISCTAMASGAYDLPRTDRGGGRVRTNIFGEAGSNYLVPMQHAETIPRSTRRRDFVLADPLDKISPIDEQRAWAEKLRTLGHRTMLIELRGSGPDNHGLGNQAIRAAATCAKDLDDDRVLAAAKSG
jgi:predicted esterase